MKRQMLSVGCCLGLLASAGGLAQSGPPPGYGYGAPQMPYAPPGPEAAAPYGYPGAGGPPPGAYPGSPPPAERSERGAANPMERMMAPMGKMTEPAGQMAQPMGRMMDPMRDMMPGGDRAESRPQGVPPGYGQPPQVGPGGGYGYPPPGPPAEKESKNPMSQMMAPMGKMMEPMKNVMGGDKKAVPETSGALPPYPYGPAGGPVSYGYAPGAPMPQTRCRWLPRPPRVSVPVCCPPPAPAGGAAPLHPACARAANR